MIAGTLCRCGHLLACCADCMGWMRDNSPRIAGCWESWLSNGLGERWPLSRDCANAAERDDLAYFVSCRYSRND